MGFTWGVCSSRLTLKRQQGRREEGQPQMADLGLLIREIQHDAAALPTDALQTEIETGLEVLDAAIRQVFSIRPGTETVDDRINATADVIVAALTTALYVQQLVSRPAPDVAWTFTSSVN
jgi:hypothetical protein